MIIIVLVILEQVQTDYFDASVPINKDLQEAVCALISADGSDIVTEEENVSFLNIIPSSHGHKTINGSKCIRTHIKAQCCLDGPCYRDMYLYI